MRLFKHVSAESLISTLILENPTFSYGIITFKTMEQQINAAKNQTIYLGEENSVQDLQTIWN